jgi:hypothetical protein
MNCEQKRQAFIKAVSQIDISKLSEIMLKEIKDLEQILNNEANEDKVKLIEDVVDKYRPLRVTYKNLLSDLREKEIQTQQEKDKDADKGPSTKDDNPENSSPTASNPPQSTDDNPENSSSTVNNS